MFTVSELREHLDAMPVEAGDYRAVAIMSDGDGREVEIVDLGVDEDALDVDLVLRDRTSPDRAVARLSALREAFAYFSSDRGHYRVFLSELSPEDGSGFGYIKDSPLSGFEIREADRIVAFFD